MQTLFKLRTEKLSLFSSENTWMWEQHLLHHSEFGSQSRSSNFHKCDVETWSYTDGLFSETGDVLCPVVNSSFSEGGWAGFFLKRGNLKKHSKHKLLLKNSIFIRLQNMSEWIFKATNRHPLWTCCGALTCQSQTANEGRSVVTVMMVSEIVGGVVTCTLIHHAIQQIW